MFIKEKKKSHIQALSLLGLHSNKPTLDHIENENSIKIHQLKYFHTSFENTFSYWNKTAISFRKQHVMARHDMSAGSNSDISTCSK